MSESSPVKPTVSVVMPCLNEEEALPSCLEKIEKVFARAGINGEIVVADNGSTDRSVEIAQSMGARVVHQPVRGYGSAYHKGFAEARGDFLVMGDADDTYDFNLIPDFLEKLQKEGYDFVTGSRYLKGGDEHITLLHRYIGNPMLTLILNLLFGTQYSDVYCGFRAFSRQAYDLIQPVSPGMEFNLELAINARLANLKIAEIPITLAPRKGESKLNTFSDGWRSLRMMLLYSPNKVFMLPGFTLLILGCFIHLSLLIRAAQPEARSAGFLTGICAIIFTVVGVQILSLGLHAKTYSWSRRFDNNNSLLSDFYKHFKLETGLILGMIMIACGMAIIALLVTKWVLLPVSKYGLAPICASMIIVGFITVFSSIFISAMDMTKAEVRRDSNKS